MSGEPTLEKGVSSEWVVHLQELMREGGFWQGDANGTFDDDLERAVQQLQDNLGLQQTGVVDEDTWSALEQRVQPAQQADTSTEQTTDTSTGTTQPYLSDDGQWQWDGAQWQSVGSSGDQSTLQSTNQSTDTSTSADTSTDGSTSSTSDTTGYPTLSKGISSEWVQYLQQVLQAAGYWTSAITGEFGDELEQVVRTLQAGNGLRQTGTVDGQTWEMVTNLAQAASGTGGGSSGQPRTATNPDGTCPKPADISEAEDWIIQHESGWIPTAKNPSSSAFGLGQLLKENRVKYLGDKADSTDCDDQIRAFRGYVKDAYGTAERAKQFWQATSTKDATKAPANLQRKARTWIENGWVGY